MPPPARAVSTARPTDAELGAEALRGDREAFAELFGRHESGLVNVAYRMTGSRDDAADIAQEAFLRVFASLPRLAGREDVDLAAYLHRTARNLVYDRSAGRARETPVAAIEAVAGADRDSGSDPEMTALVGAQGEEVRAANARLPERHRLALALRELEGMGYAEIGRVLDITPGAVGQLLARARLALRRELRLEQVDAEAMDPACRARLGDIAALVDGELDPDRAHVLGRHLEACAACRAARAAFEDAGRRYRAWLPLPVVLGLGADTARAAEARGLVRFDGAARAARGAGRLAGLRRAGGAPRAAALAGAAAAGLAVLVAVPLLVASRSGSGGGEPVAAPAAVATSGTTAIAATTVPPATTPAPPATTVTSRATTTTEASPSPAAAAVATGGAAPAPAAAPPPVGTTPRPPADTTRRAGTTAPARPRPGTSPAAGVAVAPPAAPATTGAAPPTPPAPAGEPPPPRADPPADDPPPPTTTPTVPTTPTRTGPPDIPFPTTFTGAQPPVAVP